MSIIENPEFRHDLLQITRPARYFGGEFGTYSYSSEQSLKVAISYPDLYEIGMSNQALRILYNRFNGLDSVQCERVFFPFTDFEDLLRKKHRPLTTIESGLPLSKLDLIAFTVGYELTLTNLLGILDLGGIPLNAEERSDNDPIVIAGGPATTNPLPLGGFCDAVFVGEAEPLFDSFFPDYVTKIKAGAGRRELLDFIKTHPSFWWKGKRQKTFRSVASGFTPPTSNGFPLSSVETVQDHGVIEIMRGCPAGCRFCAAGVSYRPQRCKTVADIVSEADHLVFGCGYRTLTLSSLSSADYPGIDRLVAFLTERYAPYNVALSLPSLRVNASTLPLIDRLSAGHRSGLTFAVETANAQLRQSLNKEVDEERIEILVKRAAERGWRSVKMYFMFGLPQTIDTMDEVEECVAFIERLQRQTGMEFHVNIGIFIPKPHTPYERVRQLTDSEGMARFAAFRSRISKKKIKVSCHSPFISFLEGVISRGDERVGNLILEAYRRGARLDSWDEHFNRDLWRTVIDDAEWDVEAEMCCGREPDDALPWGCISMGVSPGYYKREEERSRSGIKTPYCDKVCAEPCGVCNGELSVIAPIDPSFDGIPTLPNSDAFNPVRILFKFSKKGQARFLGHLDTMRAFERALLRARLPHAFSQGFRPKPRIEFAQPLALGIYGVNEIAAVEGFCDRSEEEWIEALNSALQPGLQVTECRFQKPPADGRRYPSLMSLFVGGHYRIEALGIESYHKALCRYREEKGVPSKLLSIGDVDNDSFEVVIKVGKESQRSNLLKIMGEATGLSPYTLPIEIMRVKTFLKHDFFIRRG